MPRDQSIAGDVASWCSSPITGIFPRSSSSARADSTLRHLAEDFAGQGGVVLGAVAVRRVGEDRLAEARDTPPA